MANNVKGKAKPMPYPKKPKNGPTLAPFDISEMSPPKNGAVHEKETMAKVSAIKKMPLKLFILALLSDRVLHFEGNVSSNAPKKEKAKIKNMTKKTTLVTQCVENSYKMFLLFTKVSSKPNKLKMIMMAKEYCKATLMPDFLSFERFKKKLTVIGNIAKTQGVMMENKPPKMPSITSIRLLRCSFGASLLGVAVTAASAFVAISVCFASVWGTEAIAVAVSAAEESTWLVASVISKLNFLV